MKYLSSYFRWVIFLFFVILLMLLSIQNILKISLSDDNLYLYVNHFNITDNSQSNLINKKIISHIKNLDEGQEQSQRFDFRYQYRNNYLLHSITIAAASYFSCDFYGCKNYPDLIRARLILGLSFAQLICFLIILLPIIKIYSNNKSYLKENSLSLLYGVLILITLSIFLEGKNDQLFSDSLFKEFVNLPSYVISPGRNFNILGTTPRNSATFMLIGIFVLRWTNNYRYSYYLIFLMSLVHTSYAGLSLGILVFLDFFRNKGFSAVRENIYPIILTILTLGILNNAWQAFNVSYIFWGVSFLMIAILIFSYTKKTSNLITPSLAQNTLKSVVLNDFFLSLFGILTVFLLANIFIEISTGMEQKYVFREFLNRVIPLLRIPLILAIPFILNIRKFNKFFLTFWLFFLLVIPFKSSYENNGWNLNTISKINNSLIFNEESKGMLHDELTYYFSLSCQLDRICNYVDVILEKKKPKLLEMDF